MADAQAVAVTQHPIRKFRDTALAIVKFWPAWIVVAIIALLVVVFDRAAKGVIVRNIPILGPWAIRKAVGATAAPVATATAADGTVVAVAAAPVESDGMPG
jgi:hypothetical protein